MCPLQRTIRQKISRCLRFLAHSPNRKSGQVHCLVNLMRKWRPASLPLFKHCHCVASWIWNLTNNPATRKTHSGVHFSFQTLKTIESQRGESSGLGLGSIHRLTRSCRVVTKFSDAHQRRRHNWRSTKDKMPSKNKKITILLLLWSVTTSVETFLSLVQHISTGEKLHQFHLREDLPENISQKPATRLWTDKQESMLWLKKWNTCILFTTTLVCSSLLQSTPVFSSLLQSAPVFSSVPVHSSPLKSFPAHSSLNLRFSKGFGFQMT